MATEKKFSCVIQGISILIIASIHLSNSHSCSHSIPKRHEVVHGVPLEPDHIIKKRSIDQNLRIHLMYDRSVDRLPKDKRNLVKDDIMISAVRFWENTLKVRQTTGPIRLLWQCETDQVRYKDNDAYPYCVDGCREFTKCGDTFVPPHHLQACRVAKRGEDHRIIGYAGGGVVNADFILYVSAYSTERCDIGTTVAYAAYCQLEAAFDRPVAGYVNLCPHSISVQPHDIHQMHSTIKHEILHALGFSAGLYAFFRDDQGNPLTKRLSASGRPPFNETLQLHQWSEKVVKTVTRNDWKVNKGKVKKTVNMIVTPRVKAEVRKHFNCSTLEGAELEDQGVLGTALTHWEKRVFENEVMTGTYTQNPTISRITLALMEDTGWYKVNYDNAEPLGWGQNLGCDFVKKSCFEWIDIKSRRNEHIHPYCSRVKRDGLQTECTEDRDAVALCNLIEYDTDLPEDYQHFRKLGGVPDEDVKKFAGSVVLADYCPYIQEFNWKKGDVVVRGSRCGIHQNNADPEINYTLEQYGNKSRCFDHSEPWILKHCKMTHSVEHWGSGCYQHRCSPTEGLLIVIKGREFRCYKAGQQIDIRVISRDWLHEGVVVCPACDEVCKDPDFLCPEEVNPPLPLDDAIQDIPCNKAISTVTHTLVTIFITTLIPAIFQQGHL